MFSQHGNRGLAYGAYAELARSSGDTSLNAGVTVTWLLHSKLSFAPSLGAYHRFADVGETGYAVGIFIGRRDTDASAVSTFRSEFASTTAPICPTTTR